MTRRQLMTSSERFSRSTSRLPLDCPLAPFLTKTGKNKVRISRLLCCGKTVFECNFPAYPDAVAPFRQHLVVGLSLIHISEPTRQAEISYAVFCLIKKN